MLPYRMKKYQTIYDKGVYTSLKFAYFQYTYRFYSSTQAAKEFREAMAFDGGVIRAGVVKEDGF